MASTMWCVAVALLHTALLWQVASCGREPAQKPMGSPAEPAASSAPPQYRQKLLSLHESLVRIESITGAEAEVGKFLTEYLEAHGYRTETQAIAPNDEAGPSSKRFNVFARRKPAFPGLSGRWDARLLVTSHIDVVPPHIPYSIGTGPDDRVSSDTVIRGRGSVDAKASVAAQLVAVEELLESGSIDPEDIALLYVVGEEADGIGMRHFSESVQASRPPDSAFNAVIFGEPTENKLACGHKGHMACSVTARGQSGHSGYPWLGKSANEVLMRALLGVMDADLGSSNKFGNTTVNVGVLSGGVAANVIAESARARIAVRVAIGPQTSGHELVRERIFDVLREVDAESLDMTCDNGYGVVECNCDVPGFDTVVVNYGTDVPNLAGNHTRYLYGPGSILVAHSDHEELRVRDLETAVEGYKKLIKHALPAKPAQ